MDESESSELPFSREIMLCTAFCCFFTLGIGMDETLVFPAIPAASAIFAALLYNQFRASFCHFNIYSNSQLFIPLR